MDSNFSMSEHTLTRNVSTVAARVSSTSMFGTAMTGWALSFGSSDQELYAIDDGKKLLLYSWVYSDDVDFLKSHDGQKMLKDWIEEHEGFGTQTDNAECV